jgi:hypothetical protein
MHFSFTVNRCLYWLYLFECEPPVCCVSPVRNVIESVIFKSIWVHKLNCLGDRKKKDILVNTLFILHLIYVLQRIIGKCLIFLCSYSSLISFASRVMSWSSFWTCVVFTGSHIIFKEHCMTPVVVTFLSLLVDSFKSLWVSVVSLWWVS